MMRRFVRWSSLPVDPGVAGREQDCSWIAGHLVASNDNDLGKKGSHAHAACFVSQKDNKIMLSFPEAGQQWRWSDLIYSPIVKMSRIGREKEVGDGGQVLSLEQLVNCGLRPGLEARI